MIIHKIALKNNGVGFLINLKVNFRALGRARHSNAE